MYRTTFAAVLSFLTAFASEAHARPIDEIGWVYDRALEHVNSASRTVASEDKRATRLFDRGVYIDYDCLVGSGSALNKRGDCVVRLHDSSTHVTCYATAPAGIASAEQLPLSSLSFTCTK